MAYSPDPHLSYRDFRQACRAFKPSELVPAIAAASAALGEPPFSRGATGRLPPWGLAAAARESLLYGNELRSKQPDQRAIEALMRKYQIAADIPAEDQFGDEFLVSLMTQFTYEQFPYQESMYEELARSHAWLIEGLADVETKLVTEKVLADIVGGMPLREAIGATFFLQVGALQNGGIYDPGWLTQPNFADVLKLYPRSNIETVVSRLTTNVDDFRSDFKANALANPLLDRFDYNPLVTTPFVALGDRPPVAPATRLIARTVTPGGLYYAGISAHGAPFAEDLGHLFEHYIGRQLRQIEGAVVLPEISYGKGKGSKSVDWFVIMPGLVLLVEVKSRRLALAARAGGPSLLDALDATLATARKQVARTVENLAAGTLEFRDIPTDRPILGLIVTAEPFYTGAAYLLDHEAAAIPASQLPDVPITAASAREIELLVTHGKDTEPILLDLITKRGTGVISLRGVGKRLGAENTILANAWNSYPWPGDLPTTNFGGA